MLFRNLRYAVVWALLILVVCLMPGSAVDGYSIFAKLPLDKLVHAFLFGVFFVLLVKGLRRQAIYKGLQHHSLLASFSIAFMYGVATEFLQEVTQLGRHSEFTDILANTVGMILGMAYLRWGEEWVMHFREH